MKDHSIKIVANYLPQFHRIPENDKWWGEGFTDWKAVQSAQPLFTGHREPRIPLMGYYDLSDERCIRAQVELANRYNIYGFAIYHYWFNSKLQLLQKPAEIILENKDFDIHYLFLWDNQSWVRTWSKIRKANDWAPDYDGSENGTDSGILAELDYGSEKDWEAHFDYLLPFFKDERYIKIDGKPIFGFFNSSVKKQKHVLNSMAIFWDKLAKQNGLNGVICMGNADFKDGNLDYRFLYSPFRFSNFTGAARFKFYSSIRQHFGQLKLFSYKKCWDQALYNAKHSCEKTLALSGFVDFDDSPRRGEKGRIVIGGSVNLFSKYLRKIIKIAEEKNKEFIFITAWNEWGEGAYLEPDTVNEYSYLEAIKSITDHDEKCWKNK